MPDRLPIKLAKNISDNYNCKQVIVFAWDGKTTHVVTYGSTIEDCDQAAQGANSIKKQWGWPNHTDEPSRVSLENKLLKQTIRDLKNNKI